MTLEAELPAPAALRQRVAALLDPTSRRFGARLVRTINIAIIVAGLSGVILASDAGSGSGQDLLVVVPLAAFALEYLVRLWVVPDMGIGQGDSAGRVRRRWMVSGRGLVDLMGAVLIPAAWIAGVPATEAEMFGVLWVFKLARYSQGLAVLWRVICLEAEPLIGVLFAFLVVLLCAAVLAHLLEGTVQPAVFGTVPKALWWTIVTLTTTGYGDVTPITVPGRMLAGVVMMCGIIVFALWAGILATGFAQEMRRRAFLKTWDLVARVPLFQNVGATVIADVAQRLRSREVDRGSVVVRRGEVGDCMYFIVSGDIVVQTTPTTSFHLKDGDFFGELALITGARRSATAVAVRPSQLLMLDIADFRDLAARYPDLTAAIHREAERRMNRTTDERRV
jgi:voltage-gated potassium channel